MTDTFIADVTGSIRRSLFHRLKAHGFSQHELTNIVAGATRAAVLRARVADLATVLAAAAPVVAALEAASPGDPALTTFNTVKSGRDQAVQDLLALTPE
jgi:hypothetical protein